MKIRVGIAADIGLREHMEDDHATYDDAAREFFSAEVYDGHGGREAALVAAEMLTPCFLDAWKRELEKTASERVPLHELIRDAYCETDQFILEKGIRSGATVATLYLMGDRFLAANAGDARVVLGTRAGALLLTLDHKASLPEERERIEALGGQVINLDAPRVQGILNISRSLGDGYLKPYVTCEPRIVEGYLGQENDYGIVACDGVWDVLSPEEAMKLIRKAKDPQEGAERIKIRALEKRSSDNLTVLVVDLREHTQYLQRKTTEITSTIDTATEPRTQAVQ